MQTRGIDPFLYRSYETELERRLKNAPVKKTSPPSGFEQELRRSLATETAMSLSGGQVSRRLTREQIREHIGSDPGRAKLYEAAEQFEAFFLEKMFKEMKKSIGKEGLIHGGFAEEVFDEMLLAERVGQMAHQVEFGLAETIYRQMARM